MTYSVNDNQFLPFSNESVYVHILMHFDKCIDAISKNCSLELLVALDSNILSISVKHVKCPKARHLRFRYHFRLDLFTVVAVCHVSILPLVALQFINFILFTIF